VKWLLTGGTALGSAHADSGLACQDSVAWWTKDDGQQGALVAVAALADGAGSARLAEIGSQTAVAHVIRLAKCLAGVAEPADDDERSFLKAASECSVAPEDADAEAVCLATALFAAARRAIHQAALDRETDLQDLATTLMIALVTTQSLVVGQVGDGVIGVRLRTGEVIGPAAPQRGEYANEATFITSGDDLPEISLASLAVSDVDAFGISSDGMRLLITSNPVAGTPYSPFFDDVFAAVASGMGSDALTRFLEQAEDRTGDDKSLVIGVQAR
jgi:hypothetical protein